MINQIILVGRIENIGEEKIEIRVPRSFKNEEGNYEDDIITVIIKGNMFENVKEYCHRGDVVGTKGHIEQADNDMQIIAEKITFLSSKPSEEK